MLNKLFELIREDLDVKDQVREKLLDKSRKLVRKSSEIIKFIHRNEISKAEKLLNETLRLLKEVNENEIKFPDLFYSGSVVTAQQEFVEARLFLAIMKKEDLNSLTPDSYEMKSLPYLLGMADLIGELRRLILTKIKNDEYGPAEEYLEWMTDIYEELMSLDYPNGLIPGLRRKIDVARSLIEKTRSEIILAQKLFKVSQGL